MKNNYNENELDEYFIKVLVRKRWKDEKKK